MQQAKYVKGSRSYTASQIEAMKKELAYMARLQSAVTDRICMLTDAITSDLDVSFVHVGDVVEIDRELLAEEPEAFAIAIRNHSSRKVDYVTKAMLR